MTHPTTAALIGIQFNAAKKTYWYNLVLLTVLISKNILKRRQFKLWLFYNGEFEFTSFIKIWSTIAFHADHSYQGGGGLLQKPLIMKSVTKKEFEVYT